MNLLAFDTGTETMSIAVQRGNGGSMEVWQHSSAGGAQASTHLIPTVLDLLAQAGLALNALDAICFGAGPGSFTGLRTACSVAQGLAFGAGVPVLPVDSLLAVAEEARHSTLANDPHYVQHYATAATITALLDARMDELYAATYSFRNTAGTITWHTVQESHLVNPEALQALPNTPAPWLLAGNAFAVYGPRVAANSPLGEGATRIAASPTAMAMLRLAPQMLAAGHAVDAAHALPSYIRDKVAKTTAERTAEKAAAAHHG
jgi:tRNA threonylcarbamoyladenosine biosynthesis protein TsaB